jgi:precorrin isomerase
MIVTMMEHPWPECGRTPNNPVAGSIICLRSKGQGPDVLVANRMIHASGDSTSSDHACVLDRMIHASGDSTSSDHACVMDRMIHASGDSTSSDHALV